MDCWFEELSLKRQKFDDSVQENNFEKGLRHSTVEKYPDPVHFIYELLQNAEDQGATEAKFQLSATHLIFSHNGNPFTRQDVESITGIGNSNKPQEANKIGRFGIGFKSVFAITERPEIYTYLEGRPFAFAINHLVVPVPLSTHLDTNNQHHTQFIFPFIPEQKRSLYTKIKERLSSLGLETLLFLQHLVSIEWQTSKDHGIYLREIKGTYYELLGEKTEDKKTQSDSATYLVFARNIQLSKSDRNLDVRIAFRLDETGKIIAEPLSKLSVYFPTEQPTGLNFRVHGPFLLTDNRANIKQGNETNTRLIDECAILLGESIQRIKDAGLLTVDFLSLLPINRETIPTQFLPLYIQVLGVLKRRAMLPTTDGTCVCALQAKLANSADLRELIDAPQLSSLYGASDPLHWLSSEITLARTPDLYRYLNRNLEVEIITPDAFVRKLEAPFLEQQSDEWLVKLYTFLSKQPSLNSIVRRKPILRLENNTHVAPFSKRSPESNSDTPNAYLLREGDSKFPLVKRSLLVNEAAYTFLKVIGLSKPNIVDEVVRFILPMYRADNVAHEAEKRNKQDLYHIQEALNHATHQARKDLISELEETPFIQVYNAKTSELAWKKPGDVYCETKELLTWFEGNEQAWFISASSSFPQSLVSSLNISTSLKPIATPGTGIANDVQISNSKGFHQRGLHGFDPKASLDGLQHALENITIKKSWMLWNILLEYRHLIKGTVETSTKQTFVGSEKVEQFSTMGRLCSQEAWLPDKNGNFYPPVETFLTDLPDDFEKDSHEAYEVAMQLGMRKAEERQLADKLGISHELISLIQHDPQTIIEWYKAQQQKKAQLPSSTTHDPERRQMRAAEAALSADPKSYRAITMNKRVSAGSSETKVYLRDHNTNEDGQLICQLCHQPMPFSLPNGDEYFESYQYIDILNKEHDANHLALCPNCAAEFWYACQTEVDERADLILGIEATAGESNLIVKLDMPAHPNLRFTQRHLIDLQAAITDWLEADPSSSC